MTDPQGCWDKLRVLAQGETRDTHKAVKRIIEEFGAGVSKADLQSLRTRLEDSLVAGKYTDVPPSYLDQHGRWLAVLDSACAAAKAYKPARR